MDFVGPIGTYMKTIRKVNVHKVGKFIAIHLILISTPLQKANHIGGKHVIVHEMRIEDGMEDAPVAQSS